MKRWIAITTAIIALAALAVTVSVLFMWEDHDPRTLLTRLETTAPGQVREQILMRLKSSPGADNAMMDVIKDKSRKDKFVAEVVELLFKRNVHRQAKDVNAALLETLKSESVVIRRKAAACMAMYAKNELRAGMIDLLDDPNAEVRKQAYIVLVSGYWKYPAYGVWEHISAAGRAKMLSICRKQMKSETDSDLRILARAVVGREIEVRALQARQLASSSDLAGAEKLLQSCLELDPDNQVAQIKLIRFYLRNGDKKKAIELARKHAAIMEVPELSETPKIDGDPTDKVWKEACRIDKFYHATSKWVQREAEGRSEAYIGHKDGVLYIAVLGYEDDLSKIRATVTGRDTQPWKDDCLELIFDPANSERELYQFVINTLGAMFDKHKSDAKVNFPCKYGVKVFKDRGYMGWEFAIRGDDLGKNKIKPGVIWSMNIFRTRIGAASEQGCVWSPCGWSLRMDTYPLALFK